MLGQGCDPGEFRMRRSGRLFSGELDYSTYMDIRNRSTFLLSIGFMVSLCCARVAHSESTPCALLTQDQVSTVVGTKVGIGSPIASTGCSWTTTGAPRVTVTVSMQSEKMFAAAKSSTPPKTEKTSISGVGDEAIFTGVQNFSSLWVRKGTKFLLVRIYGLTVSEAQTKLKSLAIDALSKL